MTDAAPAPVDVNVVETAVSVLLAAAGGRPLVDALVGPADTTVDTSLAEGSVVDTVVVAVALSKITEDGDDGDDVEGTGANDIHGTASS